jgi:hypothetical protein
MPGSVFLLFLPRRQPLLQQRHLDELGVLLCSEACLGDEGGEGLGAGHSEDPVAFQLGEEGGEFGGRFGHLAHLANDRQPTLPYIPPYA